jgi:hypothetical protein
MDGGQDKTTNAKLMLKMALARERSEKNAHTQSGEMHSLKHPQQIVCV